MSDGRAISTIDCQRVDFGNNWQNNYPILIRRARRLSAGGSYDPEDLLSQATLKVLTYLDIEREVKNYVGLMLVSLLQVYQDNKRRLGNRVFAQADEFVEDSGQLQDRYTAQSVEQDYIAKETLGDVFDCLETLPGNTQELFRLRFIEDLSYVEISERMQISEACARQKIKALRAKILMWIGE
jgi:RNA polymerase sigma factor (sigma-70 family)